MAILNAQKPEGTEKPVIAAWVFTHLHGDHIGAARRIPTDNTVYPSYPALLGAS